MVSWRGDPLYVDPGAVFNGQVAGNASVNDALQLSGTESGGAAITLGTQFTGFRNLDFDRGATWTVDVARGAAPASGMIVQGFATGDTIDLTNLTPFQAAAKFNPTTHVLNAGGDGTLNFLSGDFADAYFVFNSDGGTGTDVTLAVGSGISTTVKSTVTLGSTAHPSPLTITATGIITPSTAGATGVFSNIGGGAGASASTGTGGGLGLNIQKAATLTNNGSITGGTGCNGSAGVGGAGANLLAGTLTNTGSLKGGAGGNGSGSAGGAGGAGVMLNGGSLINAGTIGGGAGGTGATSGAAGDAVKFGSAVSTLIVDPNAVFDGQVVASSAVKDVLEVVSTQAGGTAVTLGTQFTNFGTLDFASGARWTVDATKADLTSHPLTIDGFALGDKLDITNLGASGATASFDSKTHVLTITGTTTIELQFNSAFSGKHFALKADGHGGTYVELQSGAAATLAAEGHDLMNFVDDEHRALIDTGRSLFGAEGLGSGLVLHAEPVLAALGGHDLASHMLMEHGALAAHVMLK